MIDEIQTNVADVQLGNPKLTNIYNTQQNFTNLFQNDNYLNEGKLDIAPNGTDDLINDTTNKINNVYLPDEILGQLSYQGTFNASNPTTITDVQKGDYYICQTAGNKNPDGTPSSSEYNVGDWAVYNGTSWDKIDNTDAVTMVNGQIGNVETYKGTYNSGSLYWYGDAVSYNNILYLCINVNAQGTTQPTPGTNSSVWFPFGLQNAFSQINVGGSNIVASGNSTFTLIAGNGISLKPNVSNKSITITNDSSGAALTRTAFQATSWSTTYYINNIEYRAIQVANIGENPAVVVKVEQEVNNSGSSQSATGSVMTDVEFSSFISGDYLYIATEPDNLYAGAYYLLQIPATTA